MTKTLENQSTTRWQSQSRPLTFLLALGPTIALIVLGFAATHAHGQTRIGAPLNLAANQPEGCEMVVLPPLRPVVGVPPSCTFYGLDAGGSWTSQVPRGHWVINRARVRTGPRVGPMVFTIIRAMRSQAGAGGIICCSTPVESQPFTPRANQVNEVPVQMPVQNAVEPIEGERVEVVDYLAISPLTLESSAPVHMAASGAEGSASNTSFFAPSIRTGQERLMDGSVPRVTPLINADLQPCPGTRAKADAVSSATASIRAGCPTTSTPDPGTGTVPDTTPSADTSAPQADASAKTKQKAGKSIKVSVSCPADEPEGCVAEATGKIVAAKKGKKRALAAGKATKFKLGEDGSQLGPGEEVTLKLKPQGKKDKRKIKKLAGKKAFKLQARIKLVLTDVAGNADREKIKVKLKK